MSMKKILPFALAAVLILCVPAGVFAQTQKPAAAAPSAVLVYFENVSGSMSIFDKNKKPVEFDIGTRILPGYTVVTEAGDLAELQLDPNKSIIKISQMTNFTVTSLASQPEETNAFALGLGKIRMVASKATGKEKYTVKGPTAVCGVRGTDFGMDVVPGATETAFVLDGLIDFTIEKTGKTIQIAKGMMADALSAAFAAAQISSAALQGIQNELKFIKLKAEEVAAQTLADSTPKPADAPAPTETPSATPPAAETPSGAAAVTPGPLDGVMEWLRDILGMEIGSVTINSVTWAKVVLAPEFAIGALKLGLYLPVIYQGDMFDPADYYRPAGNFEWDFGFGGAAWDPLDTLADVILKIKYVEWGDNRDPFFFKVGNLDDITVGHGLIMRNFANDADFPAVRRVGLNLGLDFEFVGFEAMVNDAAAPEVMGGRLYVRPIPGFKAALGASVVADINPSADFSYLAYDSTDTGGIMFFNPGIDLDVPVVESDFLSIVGFADAAVMLPYLQTSPDSALLSAISGGATTSLPTGFAFSAVYDPASPVLLKNFGAEAGLLGNVAMVDYRLAFRYFTGTFAPAFYNTGYERSRNELVLNELTYLANPTDPQYDGSMMGVYGEGGFTWEKICSLKLGYFWPWGFNASGAMVPVDTDHLSATFALEKGVIPVVDIFGEVTYERTKFVPTILQSGTGAGLNLFDANTVVKAKISYAVAPTLDVVLLYTTTARRNPDGSLVYASPTALLPEMDTTLGIETSVHF